MTDVFFSIARIWNLVGSDIRQTERDRLRTRMCAEFGRLDKILSPERNV